MTTNEAFEVLDLYHEDAKRNDVIGRCARREIYQAYKTLARHWLEQARRSRGFRKTLYRYRLREANHWLTMARSYHCRQT